MSQVLKGAYCYIEEISERDSCLDVGLDIRQVALSNLDVLISDWDTTVRWALNHCAGSLKDFMSNTDSMAASGLI